MEKKETKENKFKIDMNDLINTAGNVAKTIGSIVVNVKDATEKTGF